MDNNRRKIKKNISGIKATWVIIIRLKARLGPEDFIRTAYNNAAHAAQRALSWMREEGKTPTIQHKPPALFTMKAILGAHTQHFLTMTEREGLDHVGSIPLVTVSWQL